MTSTIGKRAVDGAIKRAAAEAREVTLMDPVLTGFQVRVQPSGVATYLYRYQRGGKRERVVIGRHGPVWTPAQARERAGELAKMVDDGRDPKAERQMATTAPTIEKLCDEYMERHAKVHKLSHKKDEQRIRGYIKPAIGRVLVAELSRDRIRDLLADIGVNQGKQGTANRVRALLSKMMALAIEWGYRRDNPCSGLGKSVRKGGAAYAAKQVHRYLSPDEVRAVLEALAGLKDRTAAAAIRWILLTGCRHQEALDLQWSDVDRHRGRARLMTKTGEQVRAVSPQALAVLDGLARPEVGDAPVFPSPRYPNKKRASLYGPWGQALEAAKIGKCRIHDLRHTAASLAAANGASLSQIGAMLGHKSAQATYMYSHLVDADVQAVAAGVAASIEAAASAPPKVTPLHAPPTSKEALGAAASKPSGRRRRT